MPAKIVPAKTNPAWTILPTRSFIECSSASNTQLDHLSPIPGPLDCDLGGPILLAATSWSQWLQGGGTVVLASLLCVLCVAAWATNLFALPGNWMAVALLTLYVWLGPESGRAAIGLTPLVIAFAVALIAEGVEFLASALGAKQAGGSRRSTIYAVIGSMIGAIVGALVGLPIPLIGSVLAAILFGGLGATAGALYAERREGKTWKASLDVGHAAFWGRTLGTIGKTCCGLLIVLITLAAVLL